MKMIKNTSFKKSDSKCQIPTPANSNSKERSLSLSSARIDFLQSENQSTDEERLKERRKKRRSRRSVNDEEKSDPEDDSPREDYKIEIMRRLMKGFSLNETVAYYRSLNSAEYAINPQNFSLDSSLHAKQLKKRLKHLLGSEVVKVNDKSFMEHVERKLIDEKQSAMTRREEERAEMERQRLRRLMSEGYISAREMRTGTGQMLQDEPKYRKKSVRKSRTDSLPISYGKTRNKKKSSMDKRNKSANFSGNNPIHKESEDCKQLGMRCKVSSAAYRAHSEMGNSLYNSFSACEVESQMSRMSRTREEASTDSGMCDSVDELCSALSPEPRHSSATTTRPSRMDSCPTDSGLHGCSTLTHNKHRFVTTERKFRHPILVQLRNEQSVKNMYHLAEAILPDDRPRSYFDQKKSTRIDSRLH